MTNKYQELDWLGADALMAQGGVIVIDVRAEGSYQEAHIPGSMNLDLQALQNFCKREDRADQAVLVYCYHGISSQSVAQHLIQNGFTQVYSLKGGFEEWKTHHLKSSALTQKIL